jgi:hypothetical protein
MPPRTVAIVAVLVLVAAIGLRVLVVRYSLLPVSEEAVLKNALAITVGYYHQGVFKKLQITDPDQVKEVLETLHIVSDDPDGRFGKVVASTGVILKPETDIEFHFPDGYTREYKRDGKMLPLDVDRGFYRKLNEIVSRHAGQAIDILETPPELERNKMDPVNLGTDK